MNAKDLRQLLRIWADIMAEHRTYLIDLDSVVGDGDLGLTMSDGFKAAADAAQASDELDLGKLAYLAGKAMSTAVPSTMGTLMASGLMQAGKQLKGVEWLEDSLWPGFFGAFFQGVQSRGKAQLGEKTFLDGLHPAVEVLDTLADAPAGAQLPLPALARQAADAAQAAFEATRGMAARHGRMAIHGEKSRQYPDPGAAVAALLMEGFAQATNR